MNLIQKIWKNAKKIPGADTVSNRTISVYLHFLVHA